MRSISSAPSRTEQVYEMVRESICDCTLEPGKHLVQEELAAKLGVSRQPIQQAMLLLKNDGLVTETGGRGLYVAPLDPVVIGHRYQIRMVLDDLAARLVARNASGCDGFRDALVGEGRAILAEGEATRKDGDVVRTVALDVKFHQFLYEKSGNPMIAPTADPHWYYLRRVMIAVLLHAERGALVWDQHRQILDSLASGDEEGSARLVRAHIEGAREALIAALGKTGNETRAAG